MFRADADTGAGCVLMLISDSYRELNRRLHRDPNYGTTGRKLAKRILNFYDSTDILDYGCGKMTLEEALGFKIKNYDPAVEGFEIAEAAEVVVCTDVLEHIEPEFLEEVLKDLRRLAKKFCYMTIASRPAKKFLEDGRNAHLIQKDYIWWAQRIGRHFEIEGVMIWPNGFEVLCR